MKPPEENPAFEVTGRANSGQPTGWRLTRCPFCGEPFDGGPRVVPPHIEEEHGPEDAGLTADPEDYGIGKPRVAADGGRP